MAKDVWNTAGVANRVRKDRNTCEVCKNNKICKFVDKYEGLILGIDKLGEEFDTGMKIFDITLTCKMFVDKGNDGIGVRGNENYPKTSLTMGDR